MSTSACKQAPFFHVELTGSAYQAGQMQGQAIRTIPGWLNFIRSGKGSFSTGEFQRVLRACERACPGLVEEAQGLADATQTPIEDLVYFAQSYLRVPQAAPGHCSHFAVLPAHTRDGHMLVGRSYEFSDSADDMRLVTTRIDGRYTHIGTSTLLFGRGEGMNEHGLSVTTSAGGMPVGPVLPAIQEGFQFWALTRAILENCRTVDEALALIDAFPLACNPILIIAERGEQAAKVEMHGPTRSIQRIPAASEPFVCATNHYTLPEMLPLQPARMENSITRLAALEAFLAQGPVELESIRRFLATPYPAGPTCHYYEEYFGTMRSMIFDLTAGRLEMCFGSPAVNGWHTFDLSTPASPVPYLASLPQEKASSTFWQMG